MKRYYVYVCISQKIKDCIENIGEGLYDGVFLFDKKWYIIREGLSDGISLVL